MPDSRPSSPSVRLLGASAAMASLRAEIAAAARTHAKVLILGETGAGKEVVARLIHAQSARHARPCVAVNCSGIPETLLESELFGHVRGSFTGAFRDKLGLVRQADRSTLFLDELGEMSLRMQAVLLRFTETGEVQPVGAEGPTGRTDVRLITATNRDLHKQIADGAFREDLYYRLNVIEIRVPPLRERREDVPELVEHYLAQASQIHCLRRPTLSAGAAEVLAAYSWPGNVRELRNVAERLVLQERLRPIAVDDLPAEVRSASSQRGAVPMPMGARRVERDEQPAAPVGGHVLTPVAERLWNEMAAGQDFWSVVGQAFKARNVTRAELAAIVDRGLEETRGSYRALLGVFNLPLSDYKRFHAFLYQQRCNLPVAPYRTGRLPARNATPAVHC